MIRFNKAAGQKILELGGGDNPHPETTCRVDARAGQFTNFVANFDSPLPIASDEFDAVFSQFCIEHLSWPKVRQFVSEMGRVLKPGGKAIVVTANTAAQIEWLASHPDGWNGKPFYDSASELIFGSQDYTENHHKCFFNPAIAIQLFAEAGFRNVTIMPCGDAQTDMLIQAEKPSPMTALREHITTMENEEQPQQGIKAEDIYRLVAKMEESQQKVIAESIDKSRQEAFKGRVQPKMQFVLPVTTEAQGKAAEQPPAEWEKSEIEKLMETTEGRSTVFDKTYFNGGAKYGGYAREGMWDFPIHNVTVQHILARKPASVLELGAGRGYVLKRLYDANVPGVGLEISKHCRMTRVEANVFQHDICQTPWPEKFMLKYINFDLCYSIATLEHIPEQFLPAVIGEMARLCKRGLHGIDFGDKDDGFDRTHCTLRSKAYWQEMFSRYAPGWPVEIVDKEELERGEMPKEVIEGDGRLKLNVGSFTTMHHYGWTNLDIQDLIGYAAHYRYKFQQCDVRNGLPYNTGVADRIQTNHMVEHLTYEEGLNFFRECRRVIRPDGAMRIIVPDAHKLISSYATETMRDSIGACPLSEFDEISDPAASRKTAMGKLWELLCGGGHLAFYDSVTMCVALKEAGWISQVVQFRQPGFEDTPYAEACRQIVRETVDMQPCLSLICVAIPRLG